LIHSNNGVVELAGGAKFSGAIIRIAGFKLCLPRRSASPK